MRSTLTGLLLILAILPGFSQEKKPLDHSVFEKWNNVGAYRISPDGEWLAWVVEPARGDGNLFLRNLKTGETRKFERGSQPAFLPDSKTFLFKIQPPYEMVRKAKLDKKKSDQMPKDSLGILSLANGKTEYVGRVKSFQLPDETSSWYAYQLEKALPLEDTLKVSEEMEETEKERIKEKKAEIKKQKEALKKAKGTDLVLVNTRTGKEYVFNDITGLKVSKKGELFAFSEVREDSVVHSRILGFDTGRERLTALFSGTGEVRNLTVDEAGSQLAFLFTDDTTDTKIYSLYHAEMKKEESKEIVSGSTDGMPEGWCVSGNQSLRFSPSGERLFFGTAPKPEPEKKDSLLPDEKYVMDLWSWTDGLIQPMQKANLSRLRNRSFTAVYHIQKKNMVQLADESLPEVWVAEKGDGDVGLGRDNTPYLKYISWDAGGYADYYRVDVNSGQREKLFDMSRNHIMLSPVGKYLYWFDSADSAWYAYNLERENTVNLTGRLEARFYDPLHDTPSPVSHNGFAGWTEDDKAFLVYDYTDIWRLDPAGKMDPINLTAGHGARNQIRYRYINLDRDKDYIPENGILLANMFNLKTKASGYAGFYTDQPSQPHILLTGDFAFTAEQKAENADVLVYKRSSFTEYPDLWVSDMKFRKQEKISLANPQQEEYLWGTAELVEWTSYAGELLQGILYKPENFDPSKKYPLMVYFYERYSDALHRHIPPRPGHNVNFTQYVSNGYLVFLPDISYTTGYPGESAYNAVVSGTRHLIDKYPFIDRERIGMQGHSWGAYQVCYIITRTNLFRAAEAGAPVSNMTSAYGGIRWESGMVRQFQYEETQSRIGGTLWEKPWQYIENSPLFYVPRIETPLLILHNDDDGAVPWYQGIEMYAAMRRLGKPVWLLNYNGEPHHLTTWGNRMDYTIRMMQFFDHYLKDAPAPEWMVKGIPAVEKGVNDGYMLMEE